jgi:Amt family ammonium transporter
VFAFHGGRQGPVSTSRIVSRAGRVCKGTTIVETIFGSACRPVFAGSVPFLFCNRLKAVFGYDDALDTFGVHAVGGTIGAFLTGILATASVNPNLAAGNPAARANGLAGLVAHGGLWHEQLMAIAFTLLLAVVATTILGFLPKAAIGLRPSPEAERQGLDVTEHGE